MPVVATVHDVAWLRVQAHARPYARYYFGRFSLERYRGCAAIAVDSEFSRGELLSLLAGYEPQRVRVVYPGVARDFCDCSARGAAIAARSWPSERSNAERTSAALIRAASAA